MKNYDLSDFEEWVVNEQTKAWKYLNTPENRGSVAAMDRDKRLNDLEVTAVCIEEFRSKMAKN